MDLFRVRGAQPLRGHNEVRSLNLTAVDLGFKPVTKRDKFVVANAAVCRDTGHDPLQALQATSQLIEVGVDASEAATQPPEIRTLLRRELPVAQAVFERAECFRERMDTG